MSLSYEALKHTFDFSVGSKAGMAEGPSVVWLAAVELKWEQLSCY